MNTRGAAGATTCGAAAGGARYVGAAGATKLGAARTGIAAAIGVVGATTGARYATLGTVGAYTGAVTEGRTMFARGIGDAHVGAALGTNDGL